MIRHFFLDKTNTIIENSYQNMGLNPILSIGYGNNIMRGLIHFDIDEIKKMITNKTFASVDKLHFYLKMINCFSISNKHADLVGNKKRATSFDLMLFKLPCDFDKGRGYDYDNDFWITDRSNLSTDGSSWFCSKTSVPWFKYGEEYNKEEDEGGIYTKNFLKKEYEAFKNNEKSIIINTQHFDFGDETLYMDITKYVLDIINNNEDNTGLCLSFTPDYENLDTVSTNYVSFFTDNTNTYFHPFIEVIYDDYISDKRNCFVNSNCEKLYLYVNENGVPCNLDELPICTIENINLPVKQFSKGIYYTEVSKDVINLEEEMLYYDKWSNLKLNGEILDDLELEFYVNKKQHRLEIGKQAEPKNIYPLVFGINTGENVQQGEIREINVTLTQKYSDRNIFLNKNAEYRLYIKDGNREIGIIKSLIEMGSNYNFFNIYTEDLIPNEYFIDIIIWSGNEKKIFKEVLRFNIINNLTERYQ